MSSPPPPASQPTLTQQVNALFFQARQVVDAGVAGAVGATTSLVQGAVATLGQALGLVGSLASQFLQAFAQAVTAFTQAQLSALSSQLERLTMGIDLVAQAVDTVYLYALPALNQRVNDVWDWLHAIPEHIFGWVADSVVGQTERWLVELPGRLYHAQPPGALPAPDEFPPLDTLAELRAAAAALEAGGGHWLAQETDVLLAQARADLGLPAAGAPAAPLPPPPP